MDPGTEFSVDVAVVPGGVVVAPRGEIDMATVDMVRDACERPTGTLVLDLRGVEFLDTSGLNLVLECQRRAETEGSRFALVRGDAAVQRLFDVLGLNHRLAFVDDPDQALSDGRPPG
jgi:anti-sigma B factor antagonist